MKIGMMQPYFFPYIGYFQLLNMVDKYVVFDTAYFANIKWGFRDRILIKGAPGFFRVKTLKASQTSSSCWRIMIIWPNVMQHPSNWSVIIWILKQSSFL